MKKFNKYIKKIYLPVLLILILSFSRLIPHPWNFSPILATGIFAGFYFRNFYLSLFIVIFSMFLGDLFLGFHNTMFFTYISLSAAVGLGIYIKSFKITEIAISGVISSIVFFLVTNFGAWLTLEIYEKSLSGLINSYVMAIPFFHNTLIGTFLYLIVLKVVLESILNKQKIFTKSI